MVTFSGNPLKPPSINTSRPAGTAKRWLGYAVVIGAAFAVMAASQATITPLVNRGLARIPGVNSGAGSIPGWEGV